MSEASSIPKGEGRKLRRARNAVKRYGRFAESELRPVQVHALRLARAIVLADKLSKS